jgi:hypothetical protein
MKRQTYDNECREHPGHEAGRCELCEARAACDYCGGSRVVEMPCPGKSYAVRVICFCDDEPAIHVAAE